MQYLLDFLHEHVLEQRVYMVVSSPELELELTWDRLHDPMHWALRVPRSTVPVERVERAELLSRLGERGVASDALERELRAVIAAHIVVAHQLLEEARIRLGSRVVEEVLQGHRQFTRELARVTKSMLAPRLTLLHGEAAALDAASTQPTGARHLRLV